MALKGQNQTTTSTVLQSVAPAADVRTPRTVDAGTIGQACQNLIGSGSVTEQEFSTRSLGFRANGKVQIGQDRYQVTVMLVRIGTKPQS